MFIQTAKKDGNSAVVDCLIKADAIAESSEIEELTSLDMSLLDGSSDVVDDGDNVNCPGRYLQLTPLHLAVYRQRYDLFEWLMDKGTADVNALAKDNFTPLHLSATLGCSQFTEALINRGADVNCRVRNDLTPLHLAAMRNHLADNGKLTAANASGFANEKSFIVRLLTHPYNANNGQNYETVVDLLIRNGADVNAVITTSGWSSLHFALKNNYKSLVRVLIDAGARVNCSTRDGKSPLHLALESNCRLEILSLLATRGGKFNCDGRRCLYTFLYVGARSDEDAIVDELLLHQDFEKTPLILRALNSLKDEEIKRAVMCLCAIVDACNGDVGCMSVNVEIESDYADSSKSLRINRVNVRESEVYSKFACDRVLGGALRDCRQRGRYVYDYLSMLSAVRLPIVRNFTTSRTQSIADFYKHDKLKTHYERCLEEVEKLKTYLVDDRVSLYRVLHMRPKRRRYYTKNLNLREIESQFEIYCKLVLARYREDVIKRELMDTVQLALYQLTCVQLPIVCVEEIFADLGVMNMIATIEAAEMIV